MNEDQEITTIDNAFGSPPGWILHNGIWLITVIFMIILGISYFVKYPDTLVMHGVVHSELAPLDILSKQSGTIEALDIKHNQTVDSDQVIIRIASTLHYNDLIELDNFINHIEDSEDPRVLSDYNVKELHLGSINESYTTLIQAFESFKHTFFLTETKISVSALNKEFAQTQRLIKALDEQEKTYNETMVLNEKSLNRNKYLQQEGALADAEMEKTQAEVLHSRMQKENYTSGRINYEVHQQQLKNQIQLLQSKRETDLSDKLLALHQAVLKVKSDIVKWEDLYLIKAPQKGIISFSRYWNINQWIKSNDTIGTILIQSNRDKIYLEGYLPITNSGKLDTGQTARVELMNYPAKEYGVLKAKVTEISLLPSRNSYLVKLALTSGLNSTYNKELPIRENLQATVIIETQDYSLLERFFQGFRDAIKNN